MACGLPVVASPVGVNSSLVREGVDGFLANDHATWVNRMEQLLTDANLRMTLGAAGRQRVEHHYCLQVTGPRLSDWLHKAAQQGR
jgi:glycosyltransferase involved in cell wall biosynthesis